MNWGALQPMSPNWVFILEKTWSLVSLTALSTQFRSYAPLRKKNSMNIKI